MKIETVVTFEHKEVIEMLLVAARAQSGIPDGSGTVSLVQDDGGNWSFTASLQLTKRGK